MCDCERINQIELEIGMLDRRIANLEYCETQVKNDAELKEIKNELEDVFNELYNLGREYQKLKER